MSKLKKCLVHLNLIWGSTSGVTVCITVIPIGCFISQSNAILILTQFLFAEEGRKERGIDNVGTEIELEGNYQQRGQIHVTTAKNYWEAEYGGCVSVLIVMQSRR